jgi:hypothetical protein
MRRRRSPRFFLVCYSHDMKPQTRSSFRVVVPIVLFVVFVNFLGGPCAEGWRKDGLDCSAEHSTDQFSRRPARLASLLRDQVSLKQAVRCQRLDLPSRPVTT